MEKISLETDVMWWYEQACEKYGALVSPELECSVRELLFSMRFMKVDPTMRSLCASRFSDFSNNDPMDALLLLRLLGKYGLRIEMSKEELGEYEGRIASKADTINWEQRRWQLAHGIFLHYSDLTNKTCIEMADIFIEEYKKSLNIPETPTDETAVEQDKEGINPAASLEKTLRAKLVGKKLKMYLRDTGDYRIIEIQEINYKGVGYDGETWNAHGIVIESTKGEEESMWWAATFGTDQLISLANEHRLEKFNFVSEIWSLTLEIEGSTKQ